MTSLASAQRSYDRRLPIDARKDAQIEADAAERAQEQREAAITVRDEALWAGVEAARVADQSFVERWQSQK